MKLYDDCIRQAADLLSGFPQKVLPKPKTDWPDGGRNQLIFRNDMSCELGGGTKGAVGGVLLTQSRELVSRDGVLLYGQDLPDLHGDVPYARLSLVRVCPEKLGEGHLLYQSIRKIEYTRYHLNPRGFMLRISSQSNRESVRVSQTALGEGLTFAQAGQAFLEGYHAHPAVEAVMTLFITEPNFPYRELAAILELAENKTKALDHLLQKVKMDCHSCKLQKVCAEVEALCEADFPKK